MRELKSVKDLPRNLDGEARQSIEEEEEMEEEV